MSRIRQLRKKLGFRPKASDRVKDAYIHHLIKDADSRSNLTLKPDVKAEPVQLEFAFLQDQSQPRNRKKAKVS